MNSSRGVLPGRDDRRVFCPSFGQLIQGPRAASASGGGVDRLDVAFEGVPVFRRVFEHVSDQVNDAGLHRCERPNVANDLGQALESVAAAEEHVPSHLYVLAVGEDTHSKLRSFTTGPSPVSELVELLE